MKFYINNEPVFIFINIKHFSFVGVHFNLSPVGGHQPGQPPWAVFYTAHKQHGNATIGNAPFCSNWKRLVLFLLPSLSIRSF